MHPDLGAGGRRPLLDQAEVLLVLFCYWAGFTVAALIECLFHAAHGATASQNANTSTLSRRAKCFHDVVAEKIGEQDEELGARRQLQRFFLVRGITPADVLAYGNIVDFQEIGNVAETICPDNHSADKLRHGNTPEQEGSVTIIILISIVNENMM